jgi:hypothetical protein
MTPELEALAAKVEALTGPDRSVDRAVFSIVAGGCFFPEFGRFWHAEGGLMGGRYPNFFTASLDSATSVFPAGTMYRSGHDGAGPDPSLFYCEAITDAPDCRKVRAVAFTEATARLACALRARTLHPLSSEGISK